MDLSVMVIVIWLIRLIRDTHQLRKLIWCVSRIIPSLHQHRAYRETRELDAAVQVELGHDVGLVVGDGPGADFELARDGFGAEAGADELEDLALAPGKAAQDFWLVWDALGERRRDVAL